MVDIAEHHAALNTMQDHPDVTTGAGRADVLVLNVVEPVALQARVGKVDLQFEGSELGGFLHITTEFFKARLK